MVGLNTSLLREKFVIKALSAKEDSAVIASSNRIDLPLCAEDGALVERYIVRAQNMHQATRMACRIYSAFRHGGALAPRTQPEFWRRLWDSVISDFERFNNENLWISVYFDGRPIFQKGTVHPFLDMIEKCAFEAPHNYDAANTAAERLFSKAGKPVSVNYDGNVALVIDLDHESANFGIILRAADRTTTFKFSVRAHDDDDIPFSHTPALMAAAAFLEGVQLSFSVGMNQVKLIYGYIDRHSKEEKYTREGVKRIEQLQSEISALQDSYHVNYRPEKPDFHRILADAEAMAEAIYEPVKE